MAEWKAREPRQPPHPCVKIRYGSRKRARGAARVLRANQPNEDSWQLGPYRCHVCGGFHIGHSKFRTKES